MNRGKVLLTSLFVKRLQAIRGCFTYSINGYGLWCTLDSQIKRRILDSTASRHILNFGPSVRHGTPHPVRTPVASVSSLCRRSLHRRVRCPSHLDLLRRDTSIRLCARGAASATPHLSSVYWAPSQNHCTRTIILPNKYLRTSVT